MLDTQSPIPLYFQLKSLLEEQIKTGQLKPGVKILSENELCKKYQISRTTARQAVQELVKVGRLVRTQGRGTYVSDFHVHKPVEQLSGFSQDMKRQGLKPHSKVLQFSAVIPPPDVARALLLNPNEAAIILKRLRYADGEVLGLDIVYLPFNRFHEVMNYDLETLSLYVVMQNEFQTVPTRTINSIEAIPLNKEIADLLEVQVGAPSLYMIEYVFDQLGHIFEYCVTYYRGDRYTIHVEINKHLSISKLDSSQVKKGNSQNINKHLYNSVPG